MPPTFATIKKPHRVSYKCEQFGVIHFKKNAHRRISKLGHHAVNCPAEIGGFRDWLHTSVARREERPDAPLIHASTFYPSANFNHFIKIAPAQ